jgi:hypothetical protein
LYLHTIAIEFFSIFSITVLRNGTRPASAAIFGGRDRATAKVPGNMIGPLLAIVSFNSSEQLVTRISCVFVI